MEEDFAQSFSRSPASDCNYPPPPPTTFPCEESEMPQSDTTTFTLYDHRTKYKLKIMYRWPLSGTEVCMIVAVNHKLMSHSLVFARRLFTVTNHTACSSWRSFHRLWGVVWGGGVAWVWVAGWGEGGYQYKKMMDEIRGNTTLSDKLHC